MLTFYDIVYGVSSPGLVPYFLFRYAHKRKSIDSIKAMLGEGVQHFKEVRDSLEPSPVAWFHAVSMGEVNVARAVISEFHRQLPEYDIIVSTITETGQNNARQHLRQLARLVFYHPVDLSPVVRKFLSALRPSLYVMMETELWPNMLINAKERGVKIFLVNGKISDRSFKWYRRAKRYLRRAFASVDAFAMQTQEDADKIASLVDKDDNIFVTGNCKFDIEPTILTEEERRELLTRLRIPADANIIVVGSTHPGEESIMLRVYREIVKELPGVKMIIAPRHPNRFDMVYSQLKESGVRVSRFSIPDVENPDFVVVDEMGKLAKLYGLGKIAIVGGSFVKIGGHNILEPATHKVPVIYGPYMDHQKEMTKLMNESDGGFQVRTYELAETLLSLLKDEERRRRAGESAYQVAMQNRGSTQKTIEIIKKYL